MGCSLLSLAPLSPEGWHQTHRHVRSRGTPSRNLVHGCDPSTKSVALRGRTCPVGPRLSAGSEIPCLALCPHTPSPPPFCFRDLVTFSSNIWIHVDEDGVRASPPLSFCTPFLLQARTDHLLCADPVLSNVATKKNRPLSWLLRCNRGLKNIVMETRKFSAMRVRESAERIMNTLLEGGVEGEGRVRQSRR